MCKMKQAFDVYLKSHYTQKGEGFTHTTIGDNNLNINVALAESSSLGVDTKEDYLAIKKIMEYKL